MTVGAVLFVSVILGNIAQQGFLARVKAFHPQWFRIMEYPDPLLGGNGFKPNSLSLATRWRCLKKIEFDQWGTMLFLLSCLSEVCGGAFLLCLLSGSNVLSKSFTF